MLFDCNENLFKIIIMMLLNWEFEIFEKIVYVYSRYMDLLLFYVRNEFLLIYNLKI